MVEERNESEELLESYSLKDDNFFIRFKNMIHGFTCPKDSKEYKIAVIERQRLLAPVMAIVIPIVLILVLALCTVTHTTKEISFETEILDPEEFNDQPLEDIPPDKPEVFEQTDITPMDVEFTPQIAMEIEAPAAVDAPVSAKPTELNAVQQVRSPVILRGLFGNRTGGMRGQLLGEFGGNQKTETAVMRSLRWLKTQQLPDGSWPNNKVAMTGLAILTYLAHGEAPGSSLEFGETVQKGIEFLLSEQAKRNDGLYTTIGSGYAHAIATYAMCEAFGLTHNPNIKASANLALKPIIDGQHPSGGWDYNFKQSERDDTSVMGWCAQAIKAAKMADIYDDPEALERCSKMCVKGFKKNGYMDGGFGYTSPQKGGLTGVGTLCLQFHWQKKSETIRSDTEAYIKNSLNNIIYNWKPEWIGYSPDRAAAGEKIEKPEDLPPGAIGGACPQYYAYYAGQSVFQAGGDQWDKWNKRMWPSYTEAQFKVEKGLTGNSCTCGLPNCKKLTTSYVDSEGNLQEIGHWVNTDAHTDRPIMDTCLAALQLMVYYRYLPTFKQVDVPVEIITDTESSNDIVIETNL